MGFMSSAAFVAGTRRLGLSPERWLRVRTWSLRLIEFSFVQGLVQALTALGALLIVRSLNKQEYAHFAIAISLCSAANVLADLGIGLGFRAVAGRVWNDKFRFGQLFATFGELRRLFSFASLAVCVPVTAWMLWRN